MLPDQLPQGPVGVLNTIVDKRGSPSCLGSPGSFGLSGQLASIAARRRDTRPVVSQARMAAAATSSALSSKYASISAWIRTRKARARSRVSAPYEPVALNRKGKNIRRSTCRRPRSWRHRREGINSSRDQSTPWPFSLSEDHALNRPLKTSRQTQGPKMQSRGDGFDRLSGTLY